MILLSAFEPFAGDNRNASLEAMRLLADCIGGAEIVKLVLPVTFRGAFPPLKRALMLYSPDAVLCLGQAAGRHALTLERVAVNLMDARMPDNAGFQPREQPVSKNGPAARFSSLPLREMTEAIRGVGVPADISSSAGTFVCNCLMYQLLGHLHRQGRGLIGGFLHVPALPDGKAPAATGLSATNIARGLSAAIAAIGEALQRR